MIIKFIRDTKTQRKGQVVEGDYKKLIHAVKKGDAVISNKYELSIYLAKLSQAFAQRRVKRQPAKKTMNVIQQPITKESEECIPCKNKKK